MSDERKDTERVNQEGGVPPAASFTSSSFTSDASSNSIVGRGVPQTSSDLLVSPSTWTEITQQASAPESPDLEQLKKNYIDAVKSYIEKCEDLASKKKFSDIEIGKLKYIKEFQLDDFKNPVDLQNGCNAYREEFKDSYQQHLKWYLKPGKILLIGVVLDAAITSGVSVSCGFDNFKVPSYNSDLSVSENIKDIATNVAVLASAILLVCALAMYVANRKNKKDYKEISDAEKLVENSYQAFVNASAVTQRQDLHSPDFVVDVDGREYGGKSSQSFAEPLDTPHQDQDRGRSHSFS